MKSSSKRTPTPAQRAALEQGFDLGLSQGTVWSTKFMPVGAVEPVEADYQAVEAVRDAAEAKHKQWRGWFAEAYEDGWKQAAANVEHLRSIAGGRS